MNCYKLYRFELFYGSSSLVWLGPVCTNYLFDFPVRNKLYFTKISLFTERSTTEIALDLYTKQNFQIQAIP